MIRRTMIYLKGHDKPITLTELNTNIDILEYKNELKKMLVDSGVYLTFLNEKENGSKDIFLCNNSIIDAIYVSDKNSKLNNTEKEDTVDNLHDIIKNLDFSNDNESLDKIDEEIKLDDIDFDEEISDVEKVENEDENNKEKLIEDGE